MSMIWIPHPTEAWIPATIVSSNDSSLIVVKTKSGAESKVPGPLHKYDEISFGSLEVSVENLVDLESYSEGIILHHIRKRFMTGQIYTLVGNILVAVNPYKSLNIYGINIMDDIYTLVKQHQQPPPHVYSIAATALNNMMDDEKDQCVLISGESGAGKTEATKKILQFISTMSKSSLSRTSVSVESQILDSNPVLESFGNAKTIRNNNSSRFGKYMEINFDQRKNIKGCNISAYLLEKTRVVSLSQYERNYHIFYMLLAGANRELRQELFLKPPEQFFYLNQSGCYEVDNRNEVVEYQTLLQAFDSLRFDSTFQKQIFQCLAAILHLGNIEFSPSKGNDNGSQVNSQSDVRNIASLLSIPSPELLERALCFRENKVGNEIIAIAVNPDKAKDQRDALAKFIYGKIFEQIVASVNSSLFRGKPGLNIGVLDIFGFEVFKENSFEQLCINYCNERLQTFFNEVIFEEEMKIYAADGISCEDIEYQDNVGCVRLIDLKGGGIFSLLDEEINVPQGSEDKLIQKLHQTFDESANTKSKYYGRNRKHPREFIVRHFAGDVTYSISNFLEKNKDAIAPGLLKLVQSSQVSFLQPPASDLASTNSSSSSKTNKMTLAAKFKMDLDSLMNTLRSTTPHFIRCVKPNELQQSDRFESILTLNQLKYSGLFEAIRIRKAGYAVRLLHQHFIDRYRHCYPQKIPLDWKNDIKKYCQYLLMYLAPKVDFAIASAAPKSQTRRSSLTRKTSMAQYESAAISAQKDSKQPKAHENSAMAAVQWCVGDTRVYLRSQNYKFHLDVIRDASVTLLAPRIQKLIRGFLTRRRFRKVFGAAAAAKEDERKRLLREQAGMEAEDVVSEAVEAMIRNDKELQARILEAKKARIKAEQERKARVLLSAAIAIQRIYRGYRQGYRGKLYLCDRILDDAVRSKDFALLRKAIGYPSKLKIFSVLTRHNYIKKIRQEYRLIDSFHEKCYGDIVRLLNSILEKIEKVQQMMMDALLRLYVRNELREAVVCDHETVLQESIQLARSHHLEEVEEYNLAITCLKKRMRIRKVLSLLQTEQSFCTNVPELLRRYDRLVLLLQEAFSCGLSGEALVMNLSGRLRNLSNLVRLRNEMRLSVELCSVSKMKAVLVKRAALVTVYGPRILREEKIAIESLQRLLFFETLMKDLRDEEKKSFGSFLDSQAEDFHENQIATAIIEDCGIENRESNSDLKEEYSLSDVRLPPFVKEIMDSLRESNTVRDFNRLVRKLLLLVPNPEKRRIFIRIYKWVVSVAFWRYRLHRSYEDDSTLPQLASSTFQSHQELEELKKTMLSQSLQSSLKDYDVDFGDVEDVLLSPLTGQPLPEHPLNFGISTSLSSTNAFNASTSLQGCYSTSPIHGDSVNASIQRLDGLASMVSPGFSFGSPKKNTCKKDGTKDNEKLKSIKKKDSQSHHPTPPSIKNDKKTKPLK